MKGIIVMWLLLSEIEKSGVNDIFWTIAPDSYYASFLLHQPENP